MASEPQQLNIPDQENDDNKNQDDVSIEAILTKIELTKGELRKAKKPTLMGIRTILGVKEREILISGNLLTKEQLTIWVQLESQETIKAREQAEINRAEVVGMNIRLNEAERKLDEATKQKENDKQSVK